MLTDAVKQYKTVVLIGGQMNNIQVVIERDESEFEAVVKNIASWEMQLYRQMGLSQFEFLLQE